MVLSIVLSVLACACGGGSMNGGASDAAADIRADVGLPDPGRDLPDVTDERPETHDDSDVMEVMVDLTPEDVDEVIQDVPADESFVEKPWRSLLYPSDWVPGFQDGEGRFLHDFSYAGYHNGEAPVALGGGNNLFVIDVTTHGADTTGATDATTSIQSAIDAVADAGGGSVFFPEGIYRVDGQLNVTASSTVLRGEGSDKSRLHFTRYKDAGVKGHLTFRGTLSTVLETPIAEDAATWDTVIAVQDANGFANGDDVQVGWVISPEFIEEHGMTGTWKTFNGTWQVFFHRDVTAVNTDSTPNTISVDVPLRYPVHISNMATVRKKHGYLKECGVESIGVTDAVGWEEAWQSDRVRVIEFNGMKDSWIHGVKSFPSPLAPSDGPVPYAQIQSNGIVVESCKRLTIDDCYLGFAQNRGGGGNGYLFEVRMSSEILTRDCKGEAGRHNFLQNWGFGLTGCVWLRNHSLDGMRASTMEFPYGAVGYSEFHHSLATANLVDGCVMDDGWSAKNRGDWSSGAGHSATENALWNTVGTGEVISYQYRHGYLIGTGPGIKARNWLPSPDGVGTEPEDWFEGEGRAATLEPKSLYVDQLARRLERQEP